MSYGNGRRDGGRRGSGDYDNNNRGALFENDRKDSDKHPDMKGQITVEGRTYWISGWWKEPKKGGKDYLSLSVQRQDEQRREGHRRSGGRRDDDRGDDRGDRRDERRDDRRDDDRRDAKDDRPRDYKRKPDDEIPF